MKLTDEDVQRHKENKYSVECVKGKVKMSDGDIIGNLCDAIEALQQKNEVVEAAYKALCEQAEIQSQMMYRWNEVLKQVRAALKQVQHDIDRAECRVGGNEDV